MITIYDRDSITEVTDAQWRNLRKAQDILRRAIVRDGNPKAVANDSYLRALLFRFLARDESEIEMEDVIIGLCGTSEPTFAMLGGYDPDVVPLKGLTMTQMTETLEEAIRRNSRKTGLLEVNLFTLPGIRHKTFFAKDGKATSDGCIRDYEYDDRWLAQLEEELK